MSKEEFLDFVNEVIDDVYDHISSPYYAKKVLQDAFYELEATQRTIKEI